MIEHTATNAGPPDRLPTGIRARRVTTAIMVATLLGFCASAAAARDLNSIVQPAFGVEGYYQTEDRCYYAEGVHEIVTKVDSYMELQHGYQWAVIREKVAPQIGMAVNMRRITESGPAPSADQMLCDAVAIHVSFVLTLGMLMVGPDAPGIEDMNRLGSGHGRVK